MLAPLRRRVPQGLYADRFTTRPEGYRFMPGRQEEELEQAWRRQRAEQGDPDADEGEFDSDDLDPATYRQLRRLAEGLRDGKCGRGQGRCMCRAVLCHRALLQQPTSLLPRQKQFESCKSLRPQFWCGRVGFRVMRPTAALAAAGLQDACNSK